MYQFTTTNVINSLTEGNDYLLSCYTVNEGKANEDVVLDIKRRARFKAKEIEAIYRAEYVEPKPAKVVIDLNSLGVNNGDHLRLNVYIRLTQGSNNSMYANMYSYKGKPFVVDFVYKGDKTAKTLVDAIKKNELNVSGGNKFLKVSDTGNVLTVEGANEYQRFYVFNIEQLDTAAHQGMGEWTILKSLEDFTVSENPANMEHFPGQEGFATYDYILHNLRIPTSARSEYLAMNAEETPILGAKYIQYTFVQHSKRNQLGMNAVGQTVDSVTNHVFYVLESLDTEWKSIFTEDTSFEVPFNVSITEVEQMKVTDRYNEDEVTPVEP